MHSAGGLQGTMADVSFPILTDVSGHSNACIHAQTIVTLGILVYRQGV